MMAGLAIENSGRRPSLGPFWRYAGYSARLIKLPVNGSPLTVWLVDARSTVAGDRLFADLTPLENRCKSLIYSDFEPLIGCGLRTDLGV